ncbi:MAG: amidohydrolase family protein [Deltaproteobacteria bacterium]|nr:amidohydrolase family protein [Deltaproteobacteria bacterium]
MTWILRSDRVLLGDGTSGFRLVPAEIAVAGGKIVQVREVGVEGFGPTPDGATVRDLTGHLVTPSFVNAHSHLAMSAFRGLATPRVMVGNVVEELYYRVESHLQPGDVRAFSRIGAWESLLAGVGCVWDHYYFGDEMVGALRDVGLEGIVAPTLQDLAGPGVPQLDRQWETTLELAADSSLTGDGIGVALGPHATDTVSPELWQRIARTSADLDLPIHVHVAQSIEEYERALSRHSASPVAGLQRDGVLEAASKLLLVHGLFVSRHDIALLNADRHMLVHCPWSQVQFGFPAPERAWLDAGIPLALGTDCGACNDTMDVQRELKLMAWGPSYATSWSPQAEHFLDDGTLGSARLLQARRSEQIGQQLLSGTTERLLDAVWSVPGAAHPGFRQGVIAPGARANLAVWDPMHPALWPGNDFLHAFVMGGTSGALRGLFLGGRTVIDPAVGPEGLLAAGGYRAHQAEASERLAMLLERAEVDPQPWRQHRGNV